MSAHCHKCGSDLVYPEGSWPVGECPVCTLESRLARLVEAAQRVVTNAYGTKPRHTKDRDGNCRDDCIPCGIAALGAVVQEVRPE